MEFSRGLTLEIRENKTTAKITTHTADYGLTWPSPPPLMMHLESLVTAKAVTPLLWASAIWYISFPDWGVKLRILLSSQADYAKTREKERETDTQLMTNIRNTHCSVKPNTASNMLSVNDNVQVIRTNLVQVEFHETAHGSSNAITEKPWVKCNWLESGAWNLTNWASKWSWIGLRLFSPRGQIQSQILDHITNKCTTTGPPCLLSGKTISNWLPTSTTADFVCCGRHTRWY